MDASGKNTGTLTAWGTPPSDQRVPARKWKGELRPGSVPPLQGVLLCSEVEKQVSDESPVTSVDLETQHWQCPEALANVFC